MSRAGATVGAFTGSVVGGMAGMVAGSVLADQERKRPGYDPDEVDSSATVGITGMIGTGLGGMIGAAIGAGSSKPKQVAGVSGVGELRLTSNGSFP